MSSLEQRYTTALPEVKQEVLRLGFLCWDIIQDESLRKRDLDMASLLDIQREQGKEEGRREENTKLKKAMLEQSLHIDSLSSKEMLLQEQINRFERTTKEKEEKLQN